MMWADGEELPTICAALGIDEDRFWRHVRSSQRFRFLIQQAGDRRRLQAQFRLAREGREALLRAMPQIEKYDPATLRWLGEQAGLAEVTPSTNRPDAGERLRLAASPPPNQAFRKRIAAQRARMDAEVARMEQSFARRQAAEASAQKNQSQQNQDVSDAKPSQNDAKPVQAAAPQSPLPPQSSSPPKPRSYAEAWQPEPRPPRPPAPPPPRSRAELLGTIIDLPGPDMHRIRYAKDPDPDEEMEAQNNGTPALR
ncbi:MAG: hypothetical protein ACK4FJ_13765 [Ferrovibrio sp.]|uniref:hypothetical protein n=1 Tax=Ferrovibrio sp. TaxID=1917215 RepID=UPI00391C6D74